MLTEKDKETLLAAAVVLAIEARWYYDMYRRTSNGLGNRNAKETREAYERYKELSRLVDEINIIATGNL
jgi:hypothetical protein